MKQRTNIKQRLIAHLERTWMNKLWASIMLAIGTLVLFVTDDMTVLLFVAWLAIPTLFVDKNVIRFK